MLGLARSSISTAATPSQNLVLRALRNPETEVRSRALLTEMAERYRLLKSGLIARNIPHLPFNSAFFALIKVTRPAEEVRQALLAEGVGVVAAPDAGAVRVSYASVANEDIEALVDALARHTN
jgi:aspartate/methionine/tyrosine aminotransferase